MKITIVVAMFEEITPLRNILAPEPLLQRGSFLYEKASYAGHDLLLVQCGIGKANAAAATAIAIELYGADRIFNMGSVGALDSRLDIGDIVLIGGFAYHDADATVFGYQYGQVPRMPATYVGDLFLLPEVSHPYYKVLPGFLVTGDSFSSNETQTATIKNHFPQATVVDMEGTAVAQIAYQYGIPVCAVKSVSDNAGKNAETSFEENLAKASANGADFLLKILDKLV